MLIIVCERSIASVNKLLEAIVATKVAMRFRNPHRFCLRFRFRKFVHTIHTSKSKSFRLMLENDVPTALWSRYLIKAESFLKADPESRKRKGGTRRTIDYGCTNVKWLLERYCQRSDFDEKPMRPGLNELINVFSLFLDICSL
jgi:hypothetical protein